MTDTKNEIVTEEVVRSGWGLLAPMVILGLLTLGTVIALIVVDSPEPTDNTTQELVAPEGKSAAKATAEEVTKWATASSSGGTFNMQVPDGWRLTIYPDNRIGGSNLSYEPGQLAVISTDSNPYISHILRFNARVLDVNKRTPLAPQWKSPQHGLKESDADFTLGSHKGKRFVGNFTEGLNQTVYQYLVDLGHNKRLSVVYTVDNNQKTTSELETVERAIQTIKLTK